MFKPVEIRKVHRSDECDSSWDWVAKDRPKFKPAFQALVAKGCDGWVLLDTLRSIEAIRDARASPDDLRRIRAGLKHGRDALEELLSDFPLPYEVREERLLLTYSPDDAEVASRLFRDLADQVRELERGAHRRRSRVRDQYRAILVRYVKQTTGKYWDDLVSELLNGALAPQSEFFQCDEDEYVREPPGDWDPISVIAYSRWRSRNKHLIDEPPLLEAQWQEKQNRVPAPTGPEPKPQRFPEWSSENIFGPKDDTDDS